jgi:hypothetical protein
MSQKFKLMLLLLIILDFYYCSGQTFDSTYNRLIYNDSTEIYLRIEKEYNEDYKLLFTSPAFNEIEYFLITFSDESILFFENEIHADLIIDEKWLGGSGFHISSSLFKKIKDKKISHFSFFISTFCSNKPSEANDEFLELRTYYMKEYYLRNNKILIKKD